MVCKTVKPTIIKKTDGENVSYPSNCSYFTCMLKVLYNTLFFKVLYIFVVIVQHKQDTRKRKESTTFFEINKMGNPRRCTGLMGIKPADLRMPDAEKNGFVKIISIGSLSIKCKKANAIGFNKPRKRQQIIS